MLSALLRFLAWFFGATTVPNRQPAPVGPPPSPAAPSPSAPRMHFFDQLAAGNPAAATDAHVADIAARLDVEPNALWAVLDVETGRFGGFDDVTARPIVRFEPHWFLHYTRGRYSRSNPSLSHPYAERRAYPQPDDQSVRWARQLRPAFDLDQDAALLATSWGKPQIMGFNFATCGFDDVHEFVRFMSVDEPSQLECVAKFLRGKRLVEALKAKEWRTVAHKYNGPDAVNDYAPKLALAYQKRERVG